MRFYSEGRGLVFDCRSALPQASRDLAVELYSQIIGQLTGLLHKINLRIVLWELDLSSGS